MLLHPTESWLRGTSDIQNETGCQSFIEVNGNGRVGLKQQLVLGHSEPKGRVMLHASLGLPKSKTQSAESQELCAKCAMLEVFFKDLKFWVHWAQTPASEGHRVDGGGSTASPFRWRPAEVDQDY